MAWAANKGDGEQEGKNIKVLAYYKLDNFLPSSDELSVQVTRVVDIPSVVSLLPVKAPDCKLPPAEPLPPSSNITISPVVNLISPVENPTPNFATVTPSKFSDKTVEELAAMSEKDQVKIR